MSTTPLLTTRDAATHLGMPVKTVRRLIRTGALRAVDVATTADTSTAHSPRWRIRPTDLDRFLASRTR